MTYTHAVGYRVCILTYFDCVSVRTGAGVDLRRADVNGVFSQAFCCPNRHLSL